MAGVFPISRRAVLVCVLAGAVAAGGAAAQPYPTNSIRFIVPFTKGGLHASSKQGSRLRDAHARESCAAAGTRTGDGSSTPYPTKSIRFIVPFTPGGGTDLIARILGQKLSEVLRQPVVVDNRPGAGSTIGTGLAAAAPPDGYTLLMSSISIAFDTTLYKQLPYDPLRDLAPVSLVATQPNMVVVNPSLPVKTMKELLALAKAKPGSINYASAGNGSGPHLATELLKLMAGIDITQINYKGTGPALNDLLGGQVQMMVSVVASAIPQVKAGRLRALAVTGGTRSPAVPDIPTVAESGVAGYEFNTWYGVQVPAKTPRAIIDRLNAETRRIVSEPDVLERFAAAGLDPLSSSPEQFGAMIRSEIAKWTKVAAAIDAAAR
jgi:tripartite-type tricarboxylate transporter receptor subunit TctC